MRCCLSASLSTMRTLPARMRTAAARELPSPYAMRTSVQLAMRTSAPCHAHAHVLLPERLAQHDAHAPRAHMHRSST